MEIKQFFASETTNHYFLLGKPSKHRIYLTIYKYLRGPKKLNVEPGCQKHKMKQSERNISNAVFREAKGKQANISRPLGAFCVLMRYYEWSWSNAESVAFAPVPPLARTTRPTSCKCKCNQLSGWRQTTKAEAKLAFPPLA